MELQALQQKYRTFIINRRNNFRIFRNFAEKTQKAVHNLFHVQDHDLRSQSARQAFVAPTALHHLSQIEKSDLQPLLFLIISVRLSLNDFA